MINNKSVYQIRYKLAKTKYIGETILCPYCEKTFCKTTAVKYFCSKKCKIHYKEIITLSKEKTGFDNSLSFIAYDNIFKYKF